MKDENFQLMQYKHAPANDVKEKVFARRPLAKLKDFGDSKP
jgi:hypothetical protein